MKLIITRTTFFKARPLQSSSLRDEEIIRVERNRTFDIESYKADRNKHWRIVFNTPYEGWWVWFVYQNHVRIEVDATGRPAVMKLNVPFKSQLDNQLNPTGACNVTSIAMCLAYFGVEPQGVDQLEDELFQYMQRKGLSRHSPQDLARVVRDYGKKDDFTVWGTFERCRDHIAAGNPCVIHGYFTSFGHIIVLVGYDDKGFIVHDPYGEWFSSGYRTDLSGEFLH
ncbi:MAG: C39 family peptidase [Oscillatoriales cyanobacterium RU_3_3]|nr:C39 family peptidase [Oscillatoriales cyanobacterium RU_3_3]